MAAEKGKGSVAAAAAEAEKGKGGRPTASETEADDGRTIKLKSSDEQIFEVPAKVAKLFKAIADVVDKGCADDIIPLPNVHSSTLAKVIEYCVNHLRIDDEPDARRWDEEFVSKLDVNDLYDVITAVHYLDQPRLPRPHLPGGLRPDGGQDLRADPRDFRNRERLHPGGGGGDGCGECLGLPGLEGRPPHAVRCSAFCRSDAVPSQILNCLLEVGW